ncbi:hypothetical protein RvY_15984-1 [Ramazzottius varieornatus]|uniref:Uncharacterized protein n=1 Tax=Ramazzottius varieornatus TaxID=947166 RepID=A0A1D1VWU6_RAMVA|nr:hypothetical protein RvY_15984-1 [Ramazzottius varieornatus]
MLENDLETTTNLEFVSCLIGLVNSNCKDQPRDDSPPGIANSLLYSDSNRFSLLIFLCLDFGIGKPGILHWTVLRFPLVSSLSDVPCGSLSWKHREHGESLSGTSRRREDLRVQSLRYTSDQQERAGQHAIYGLHGSSLPLPEGGEHYILGGARSDDADGTTLRARRVLQKVLAKTRLVLRVRHGRGPTL